MRFLMLNWRDPLNPSAGGAERVTAGYLRALVDRGHEVYWYAFGFPGGAGEEAVDGLHIVRGGGKGTAIVQARGWVREQPPFDLVVDQHHGIPWFAPWWCGTRCVSYIHEVLGPIWSAFYPWPISALGRWQERWTHWCYRRCQFWTASEFTARRLKQHRVQRVHRIPYGVDTRCLPSLPEKPLSSPLQLIVVSRLAPNKRIDHCIQTLRCLREAGIEARLEIVGDGEEAWRLRELSGRLGLKDAVRFSGRLDEQAKDRRLQESHFLLHTSQREGWGLNVIEANAMGTPAAVYPVDGLVESTLHEKTGLVAERETPDALAAVLKSCLERRDDYQRWRQAAWQRADEFHWSRVLPLACDWLEMQARGDDSESETKQAVDTAPRSTS